MLLITSADHYIGHCVTSHLSRYSALPSQLRILCENKALCLNFEKKGIDVRQVDYTHPNDLSLAMQGIDQMILAIGHETSRVTFCNHLCRVASRSGVQSIICISHVGAVSTSHDILQEYAQIEDDVMNTDCQWTILRLDWISQTFHLWAPYVEKYRALPMPVPEDIEICPIDITDVCRVVERLVLKSEWTLSTCIENQHSGQVYTLTGPQSITGKDLVRLLKSATGFDKFVYCLMRPMDMRYYLSNLCKDIWFDRRLKHERSLIYKDSLNGYAYRKRVFLAPTDVQIEIILAFFDWAKTTSSSIPVSHTTQITSVPSRSIRKFFQENACSFKPRV